MEGKRVLENRKMVFNLLSTKDTSLVGEVGEVLAKRYLWRKMGFIAHKFSLYISERERIKRRIKDKDKLKYLTDYKGRYWDLISVKYRYTSRYGRKKLEKAAAELRVALREKDEQKIKAKNEEFAQLLKKFEIEEIYLIEVKTVRKGAIRHDLSPIAKHKIGDVEGAKMHGFKVLLVIVTFLSDWKFECRYMEL